ncbi:MAG: uncharacterized membrane protein (UPF0127 family) [Glaciecola sp.]|jgi:uncharacterized membrane protein (UPF0127 family)
MPISPRLAIAATLALVLGSCSSGVGDVVPAAGSGQDASSPAVPDQGARGAAASPVDAATDVTQVFTEVPPIHASVDDYGDGQITLRSQSGARWVLPVLVADEPGERQHGLMEVTDLPYGTGMLFLFEEDRTGGFWMFGTYVDLDIVYVDAQGVPADIFHMTPCSNQPCPTYEPNASYRFTVEVPGGYFDRIGFDESWAVTIDQS